jgi:hypothetical protein
MFSESTCSGVSKTSYGYFVHFYENKRHFSATLREGGGGTKGPKVPRFFVGQNYSKMCPAIFFCNITDKLVEKT